MTEDAFEPDVATGGEDGGDASVDETVVASPDGDTAEPGGDASAEDVSTTDGDGQQDGEQTPATGGSEKLKNLLAKYGGDEEKMVDAYWEQAKSLSAMDKKLDALFEKVNSREITPEAEAKLIAEDPDVRQVGTELASLDAKIKNLDAEDKQLVKEYGRLDIHIKQLEAKLEFAPDDITKLELKREISEARRELRDVGRDWRYNTDKYDNAQSQLQTKMREYREAEAKVKTKRDQARKQESDANVARIGARSDFSNTIQAEAASYGITPDSKHFAVLEQSIRGRLVTYLRSLGPEAEGVDIPAAVGMLVEEYADVMGRKKTFSTVSKQKAGVTGKPAGAQANGAKGPPPDKTGKYWDPNWVRANAKRILG
jgi:hypothetical protein